MQLLVFLHNFPKGYIWYFVSATVIHPPSKKKWLRDIGYSMTTALDTRISNFGSQEWLWFYIWFAMTLITKCDRYYYKMRQLFYYKMRQKFIATCVRTFFTKYDSFVTKCDSYYKMWRLLQNSANTYLPQVSICCEISKTSNKLSI